jgi:hypothetical protein
MPSRDRVDVTSRVQRLVRIARRARSEGPRSLSRRVVRRAYQRLEAGALDFPLLPDDLADSVSLVWRETVQVQGDRPLRVGWLTTPPSAGSGGHTTMFRMIQALERAGHECVILLYDRHHGDLATHSAVIRAAWPWIRAEVHSVDDGLATVDACVATGWPTAHVLASRPFDGQGFYFIQDFEPFFFPHGSEYELAADTYRFGLTNIALGHMVQDRLSSELGVGSAFAPFSCDTEVYSLTNHGPRSGVVFYTKPDVGRRGYRLGALALEDFHRRHPEHEIHVYGDPVPEIGVPVTRHERLTPTELNALYNRCVAGFALSFTNISLVAEEMLAAGCVPVVNDSLDSRADLDNPHVAWALPTPAGLAEALSSAVEQAPTRSSIDVAASVRTDNWRSAGAEVVRVVQAVTRCG